MSFIKGRFGKYHIKQTEQHPFHLGSVMSFEGTHLAAREPLRPMPRGGTHRCNVQVDGAAMLGVVEWTCSQGGQLLNQSSGARPW